MYSHIDTHYLFLYGLTWIFKTSVLTVCISSHVYTCEGKQAGLENRAFNLIQSVIFKFGVKLGRGLGSCDSLPARTHSQHGFIMVSQELGIWQVPLVAHRSEQCNQTKVAETNMCSTKKKELAVNSLTSTLL